MPLSPGTRLGPYEILATLGAGGMGDVYKATDTRLGRTVAIKVAREEFSERFEREARAVAALNHPNICQLYDIGPHYLVMEFVDGTPVQPLGDRARLLDLARQIADALVSAHAAGIVHRDLKPDNILVTRDGRVKVLDFGLATVGAAGASDALATQVATSAGTAVGTVAYMSPEQARGEPVDARSDLWSLGVVLYELATGGRPFGGPTAAVVFERILNQAPPVVPDGAHGSAGLSPIVATLLEKDRTRRYQSAADLRAAIERLARPTDRARMSAARPAPPAATKGLVVLPFTNLSPDRENEFFADGLTEEVIADLSGIGALRVISRTSAMRFKGTDKDLKTIARELNVRYVLEGSVRRAGTSLRVTAQLVDADTDSHVWAEKYAGSIEDVFAIQEEISRKIVTALKVQLTDSESRQVAERPIDNAAAYDCYLQAHHEMFRFTPESLDRAQKMADRGLAIIGENPLLLATRGLVPWYFVNFSIRPDERYLDEAESFAARALEQDPKAFLGIFLRGLVAAKRGDLETGLRDMRQANELKPGSFMLGETVRHLMTAGQEYGDWGRSVYEAMLPVDPLNPLNWVQQSWFHRGTGELVEAERAARRALELAERENPARAYVAYSLALLGRREDAVAVYDDVASTLGSTPYGALSAFMARALQGDAEGAVKQVTPELEQASRWVEYLSLFLADGYALIGRRDDAMGWLNAAVSRGLINYPFLRSDPFLESLSDDAEFVSLMQQVQRRWQAFEV